MARRPALEIDGALTPASVNDELIALFDRAGFDLIAGLNNSRRRLFASVPTA